MFGKHIPTWALSVEAGDGNRTRTVSLGICAIQAVMQPDLLGALSASDREGPPVTEVNGTLMARPCAIRGEDYPLPGYGACVSEG
jgi:hypothetical protein